MILQFVVPHQTAINNRAASHTEASALLSSLTKASSLKNSQMPTIAIFGFDGLSESFSNSANVSLCSGAQTVASVGTVTKVRTVKDE